jgi:hypothetical protein
LTAVVVAGIVVDVVVGTEVVVAGEVEVVGPAEVEVTPGSDVCPEHAETAIRATTEARRRMGRR